MKNRVNALWLPCIVSLTGSMGLRFILQQTVRTSQRLLNHAGIPLLQQLLWLAVLPVFGAASAYLSCRAGGDRSTAMIAAAFPSIVMVVLWSALATQMKNPSPSQWFGLLFGVLHWIVEPGIALLVGALFCCSVTHWESAAR